MHGRRPPSRSTEEPTIAALSTAGPAREGPDGTLREWTPWLVLGGVIALLGLVEAGSRSSVGPRPSVLFALGMAIAAGLGRRAPGVALAVVWVMCASHVLLGAPVMLVEIFVVVVAFGTARWGNVPIVWLGGLSIPIAAFLAVYVIGVPVLGAVLGVNRNDVNAPALFGGLRETWQPWAVVSGVAVLGVPWTAGLAVRSWDRARASRVSLGRAEEDVVHARHESEQSREIARLREQQARLAHDVHDVVGHSLAVILAQAESAQYLPDDDPTALKATMATIADSARSSLQDVRQVLSPSQSPGSRAPGLDRLVDGVRASGRQIVDSEVGTPRPLPPELAGVAFRVLQEMLTNAVRHGRPDRPVHVERHWPDGGWEGDLRIEVRNAEATRPDPLPESGGQGIEGMRRRLESVGGRLDVRRRTEAPDPTFTVTAWVPVRSSAR